MSDPTLPLTNSSLTLSNTTDPTPTYRDTLYVQHACIMPDDHAICNHHLQVELLIPSRKSNPIGKLWQATHVL
jgi:hypothetical protein